MTNLTIENKIKIIHDFVPVKKPRLKGSWNARLYTIWNLYSRACEAIKSFAILMDNKRYYDSFLIAGHALETYSVLSYLKDHDTEGGQVESYDRYLAYSTIGHLISMLETNFSLEKNYEWEMYTSILKKFYPIGATIISDTKNIEAKHKEAFEKLNSRAGSNMAKIKLLKKYYESPSIREYLAVFSDNMENIDYRELVRYYTEYCDYKHNNIAASGALASDIAPEEIDWFLTLALELVMYLDKSKLVPYTK